jgi:phospholipid/cholesterol/gamma-HCH transport system ATP-binding protein
VELAAEGLSVRHGEVVALDGAGLRVRPGDRVLILGWTGSGKTTLLKVLAGLLRPDAGSVRWDDEDPFRLSLEKRRARQAAFGMVFQADALFDSMNVLANVELPLLRRGVAPDEARQRAREVLAQVGLADAEAVFPERLSGGMKKRAGLARAIVARPQVLLADDPLAGLDPATAAEVTAGIADAAQGRTLVWAAVEPPQALPFPRWVWLERGRIAHDGPPRPKLLELDEAVA